MATKHSVMFSGRISAGESPEAVKARLAALFHVTEGRLEGLFKGGAVALKRGLDEPTGRKWLAALEKAGALCWLEEESPVVARKPIEQGPDAPIDNAGEERQPEIQPLAVATPPPPPEPPVARFVKCPKCGRLATSIEDELMNGGECPTCGLLTDKYAKTVIEAAEAAEVAAAIHERPRESWIAFWERSAWPGYWRGALLLALLTVSLPVFLYDCTLLHGWWSLLDLMIYGLVCGLAVLICAVLGFFFEAFHRESPRLFTRACVFSLGAAGIFALLGFILHRVFTLSAGLRDILNLGRVLDNRRSLLIVIGFFPAVVLCAVLIRLPAERRLSAFLDGEEYTAKVEAARTLAGPGFPSGERHLKYEYYKFVFVGPSRLQQPDLDRTLRMLLRDYQPGGQRTSHNAEVDALVLNAIRFSEDLKNEGLISKETAAELTRLNVQASGARARE